MSGPLDLLRKFRLKRARRHWAALPAYISTAPLATLGQLSDQAATMARHVARTQSAIADRRAALAGNTLRPPARADWQYVPDIWARRITPHVMHPGSSINRIGSAEVFHDAVICEATCGQTSHGSVFGLSIDALGFDGSYLSFVIRLPDDVFEGLTKSALIGAEIAISDEAGHKAHIRLNVRHGPNTERLVREVVSNTGRQLVEFDIFHTDIDPADVNEIWVDIILDNVEMNKIDIRSLQFFRRPRAHV